MSGNPVNDNGNAQGGDFLQHKNFASELLTIQATGLLDIKYTPIE